MKIEKIDKTNWEEAIALEIKPEQFKFLRENIALHSLAKCYIYPKKYTPFLIKYKTDAIGSFRLRNYIRGVNLISFFIDKNHQGNGLGRMSLRYFINWVKDTYPQASEIELWVKPENNPARLLYEREGFYYTGETNEDGCIYMELQFNT